MLKSHYTLHANFPKKNSKYILPITKTIKNTKLYKPIENKHPINNNNSNSKITKIKIIMKKWIENLWYIEPKEVNPDSKATILFLFFNLYEEIKQKK